MRVFIGILIAVALIAVAGVLVGPKVVDRVKAQMNEKQIDLVQVESPERGTLVELVQAPGELEPARMVEISARISARVTELPYAEGDRVQAGAVVIRLDSADLEAALRGAEARRAADEARIEVSRKRIDSQRAQLEGTLATLRQAELDLERQESLLTSRDVAQSVAEAARARVKELRASVESQELGLASDLLNLRVMELSLEAADAEIDRAKDMLEDTIITAPIDGIITRIQAEVGEMVITGTMNNPGTVIMTIAELDRMLVKTQVDEVGIGAIRVGQRATVRVNAYPDEIFEGEVTNVALQFDNARDGTKYFAAEVLLQGDDNPVYTGLTANVDIETERHEDVIKVPSQAVLARTIDSLPLDLRRDNPNIDPSKTFAAVVFRYVDGKALATPVKIGASDLTHTIIESGLDESDRIVVGPYKVLEALAHEQAVKDEMEPADQPATADATAEGDAATAATTSTAAGG